MGLDIQIGALGAEYDRFKKRQDIFVFIFPLCNTHSGGAEIRPWMHCPAPPPAGQPGRFKNYVVFLPWVVVVGPCPLR